MRRLATLSLCGAWNQEESAVVGRALRRTLGDQDVTVRKYAALALGGLKEESKNVGLEIALCDVEESVRRAAAQTAYISGSGDTRVLALLTDALDDASPRLKILAALCINNVLELARLSGDDFPEQNALLKTRLPQVTDRAVRQLLTLNRKEREGDYREALKLLIEALATEDAAPTPAPYSALFYSCLGSELVSVFGDIGPQAAGIAPLLLKRLAQHCEVELGDWSHYPDQELICRTFYSLIEFGDGAIPELRQALISDQPVVRALAAMALGGQQRDHEACVPVLIDSLQYPWPGTCNYFETFTFAVVAPGKCGRTAVPALLDAVQDEALRDDAVRALGLMGHDAEAVVPLLIAALKGEREIVRLSAAEALGRLKDKATAALPALEAALEDDSPAVRDAAKAAIASIGDKP